MIILGQFFLFSTIHVFMETGNNYPIIITKYSSIKLLQYIQEHQHGLTHGILKVYIYVTNFYMYLS